MVQTNIDRQGRSRQVDGMGFRGEFSGNDTRLTAWSAVSRESRTAVGELLDTIPTCRAPVLRTRQVGGEARCYFTVTVTSSGVVLIESSA